MMKIIKLLLVFLLISIPFAIGDVAISCTPASVQSGSTVACTVSLTSVPPSVSTIDFTIQPGPLFTIQGVSGFPAGFTGSSNPTTGQVAVATAELGQRPTTLAVVTLLAGNTAGSGTMTLSGVSIQDENFVPVNYGVVLPSNVITVQSTSAAVCGNGVVETGEGDCDDGNTINGDGCTSLCQVEVGYTCNGQPSVCTVSTSTCTLGGNSRIDLTCLLDNVRTILENNVEYPSRLQKISGIALELGKYFG